MNNQICKVLNKIILNHVQFVHVKHVQLLCQTCSATLQKYCLNRDKYFLNFFKKLNNQTTTTAYFDHNGLCIISLLLSYNYVQYRYMRSLSKMYPSEEIVLESLVLSITLIKVLLLPPQDSEYPKKIFTKLIPFKFTLPQGPGQSGGTIANERMKRPRF